MVPLRESRDEDSLEIGQRPLEGLPFLGRRCRELRPNRAGDDLREDRVLERPVEVVGKPVHEAVAALAELLRGHVA
jgi:hypothetical protein